MPKSKIKAGDEVVVIAGNEKGNRGAVLQVQPRKGRVIVEGLNKRKFHEKAKSESEPGGINEREAPMHHSNVMLASRYEEKVASKQS